MTPSSPAACRWPARTSASGDLVVYGTPARQVYVYAGKGFMVGHSPEHGAVVVRRVHTGDLRFVRLRG